MDAAIIDRERDHLEEYIVEDDISNEDLNELIAETDEKDEKPDYEEEEYSQDHNEYASHPLFHEHRIYVRKMKIWKKLMKRFLMFFEYLTI